MAASGERHRWTTTRGKLGNPPWATQQETHSAAYSQLHHSYTTMHRVSWDFRVRHDGIQCDTGGRTRLISLRQAAWVAPSTLSGVLQRLGRSTWSFQIILGVSLLAEHVWLWAASTSTENKSWLFVYHTTHTTAVQCMYFISISLHLFHLIVFECRLPSAINNYLYHQ